jgi:hypothetical protein
VDSNPSYRFEIALSFAGDNKRDAVREVATLLRAEIGATRVFFDEWFESELAGHDGQTLLQNIYRSNAHLVVVCICGRYGEKPWTQEEWRAIQSFERTLRTPSAPPYFRFRLLPLRFGDGDVEGLFDTAIVPDVRSRTPQQIAQLILERHQLAKGGQVKSVSSDSERPAGKLHGVPVLPPHFLDRRDLHERCVATLTGVAAECRAPMHKLGLWGMGGIGKTVAASALATDERIGREFADGVFWITVGLHPDFDALHAQLAKAMGSKRMCQESTEWKQHLAYLSAGKRCLVVLGDVWNADQAREFESLQAPSQMLLTAREGAVVTGLGAEELAIDTLTDEEALWLLLEWCGPTNQARADALAVAKECGNLPLALAVCGAMVRDGVLWSDVLEALREADLSFLAHSDLDYAYPSVFRALKVSVDYLAIHSPADCDRYLELGAFKKDAPIPEEAILTLWCAGEAFPERQARKLRSMLARKALLSITGSPPNRQIVLHDLQHDFIHRQYEAE